MFFRLKLSLGLFIGLGLASGPAFAHQQAIGITEIELVTGGPPNCLFGLCRVEVSHRYTLHDAEVALAESQAGRFDLLSNAQAAAQFEAYVADQFQLALGPEQSVVPLSLLGGEVERGYYWVYQEGLVPRTTREVTVTNRVFMQVLPQQTNRINVRRGKTIQTLVLTRAAPMKTTVMPVVTQP